MKHGESNGTDSGAHMAVWCLDAEINAADTIAQKPL